MRATASRLRLGKRASAAVLTGLLLWAPPPVKADDDWDDDDRRGRRHRHYDDDRHHGGGRHHQHGDWCAPRHGHPKHHKHAKRYYQPPPPRYAGWGPGWYAPPRPVAHARYRCEPCGHWYDEEVTFHRHIHRHHHIAQAVIPMVIGAAAFGWIFYGH